MTIVYDPLTYRTVVARPGEIPYKFWSVNKHVIDAAAAGICTLHAGDEAPGDTTRLWLDLTMPENAVGAVKAYDGAAWVALTPVLFYAHIAGGSGGFVTDLEMATYVSGLIGVSVQAWGENLDQWSALDPTAKEDTGVAATLDAAHLAAGDPHPQYLTAAEGAAAYQPLDSDLTAIAALTTTAYGRAFLALADAAAGRTALGLGTLATQSGTFSGTSSGTNTGDQTITLTGDVTGSGTGSFAATLATVNANTGSWGLAASVSQFTVNAKGLITAAANVAISIASTAISDATAAGRSMLTAANAAAQTALLSAFVGDSGAGGLKGLVPAPVAGDSTKALFGDGTFKSIPGGGDALVANPLSQFAATTSAQLRGVLSDETGTGAAYFQGGDIGTPSAGVATNITGLPIASGVSGLGTSVATRLAINGGIREILIAARTYYVRTDGSDSNTGLVDSAGGAFLTIQKAWDTITSLDINGQSVVVQIRDGTYTAGCTCSGHVTGQTAAITFRGNVGTPSNVVISTTSANCFTATGHAWVRVEYMKFQTTTGGSCLQSSFSAQLFQGGCVFGASASSHIETFFFGTVWCDVAYTINGSAGIHLHAYSFGVIDIFGITVTVSGTPAFSNFFAGCNQATILAPGSTFSGAATGTRYLSHKNGVIDTNGGGASYFPGNVAGSTATGGLYV